MKFRVTYLNINTNVTHEIKSDLEFNFDDQQPMFEDKKFNKILTDFEDKHFVVDQGGDDDWYDLDFADGCDNVDQASVHSAGEDLLKQLEAFMTTYQSK